MVTAAVELVNIALRRIGQQTVASIDPPDADENARVAADLYSHVRDTILASHPWNCATKRVSLAASTTVPAFGYSIAYPWPTDMLKLLRTEWDESRFRVELVGEPPVKCFVTDESPFKIIYIARITNLTLIEPTLQDAIAYELASQLAARLTGLDSRMGAMKVLADRALVEAKFQDSVASPPTDSLEPRAFLDSRGGFWSRDNSVSRAW